MTGVQEAEDAKLRGDDEVGGAWGGMRGGRSLEKGAELETGRGMKEELERTMDEFADF